MGVEKHLIRRFYTAFEAAKHRAKVDALEAAGEVPGGDLSRVKNGGFTLSRFARAAEAVSTPQAFVRHLARPDLFLEFRNIRLDLVGTARPPKVIADLRRRLHSAEASDTPKDSEFLHKVRAAAACRFERPAEALRKALELCLGSETDLVDSCDALSTLAYLYQMNGDYRKASWCFELSCAGFARSPNILWPRVAMRSAHLLIEYARPQIAVEACANATGLFLLLGDVRSYDTTVLNMAECHRHMRQYQRCKANALMVVDRTDEMHLKFVASQQIAACLLIEQQPDVALPYIERLMTWARGNEGLRAYADYFYGQYLLAAGQHGEAIHWLQAAADLLRKTNRFEYCLAALAWAEATRLAGREVAPRILRDVRLTILGFGKSKGVLRAALVHLDNLNLRRARQSLERARLIVARNESRKMRRRG